METNRMFFDCDEVVKIRFLGDTYRITKNEIAKYFQKKPKSEISLTEEAIYFYLPFLISIEYVKDIIGNAMITLFPINVRMEITEELFKFLVSGEKIE